MGATESKRKAFHYRRAVFLKPVGNTLQALLESSLQSLTTAAARFLDTSLDEAEDWRRFINNHLAGLGMQFGNYVLYAPSQAKNTIAIDSSLDELDIEQILPPNGDGKDRQFLDSVLHYGIKDNHVMLLQTMSLRARDYETYLNWLLRKSGHLAEDNALFLDNTPPAIISEKFEKAQVKSVKLGTPLILSSHQKDEPIRDKTGFSIPRWGNGFELLKTLMPERMKEFGANDFINSDDLEIFVELTYRRQASQDSQELLNRLTSAMRNVGDDDLRIELKNGTTILGSELQVKTFKQVECVNGLVEQGHVYSLMHGWLLELLDQGLIDA